MNVGGLYGACSKKDSLISGIGGCAAQQGLIFDSKLWNWISFLALDSWAGHCFCFETMKRTVNIVLLIKFNVPGVKFFNFSHHVKNR